MDKIWPCHNIGYGQSIVIIWTILVVLNYPMLFFLSFFLSFFQYVLPLNLREGHQTRHGHGGHLGQVTWIVLINYLSPIPRRRHMKFGFNQSSGFRGEDVWKCWHTYIHTYIWTTEAHLHYKLTNEPKGSGKLKKSCAPSGDRSAWASAQSDQSLRWPHEESLGP